MIRTSCSLLMLFATAPASAQDRVVDASLSVEAPPGHADRLSENATVLYGFSIANFAVAAVGAAVMVYGAASVEFDVDFEIFVPGVITLCTAGAIAVALLIPAIVLDIDSGDARRSSTSVGIGPGSLHLTITF